MIRRALLSELPVIVDMGKRFLEESPYVDVIPDSTVHMTALATQLLSTGDNGTILVAETNQPNVLCGMIGLVASPHFLSGERSAGEVFFWVVPTERGTLGRDLMDAAEEWARSVGAAAIQMIAPDDRVGVFYRRRGYRAIETTYWKRLNDPNFR